MKIKSNLTNIEKIESGLQCIEMDYLNMKAHLTDPELGKHWSRQDLIETINNINENIDAYEFSMNILKKAIKAEEKKLQKTPLPKSINSFSLE